MTPAALRKPTAHAGATGSCPRVTDTASSVCASVSERAVRGGLAGGRPLARAGLRVLMADIADIEVVGEAGTGTAEAVRLARGVRSGVVVMGIRMPMPMPMPARMSSRARARAGAGAMSLTRRPLAPARSVP